MFVFRHAFDILQFPLNGGKLLQMGNTHERPVRLALFQGNQKCSFIIGELALDCANEVCSSFNKFFRGDGAADIRDRATIKTVRDKSLE